MTQYNVAPTYEVPLLDGRATNRSWWRFWQGLYLGVPPGPEQSVTVAASPFTYTAPRAGSVIVSGGTVSQIQFTRAASYVTGATAGVIPVGSGDQLTITYSVKPTITFVPN